MNEIEIPGYNPNMENKHDFRTIAAFALCGYPPKRITAHPRFANYEILERRRRDRDTASITRIHPPLPGLTVIIRAFGAPAPMLHRTLISLAASDYQRFCVLVTLSENDPMVFSCKALPGLKHVSGSCEKEVLERAVREVGAGMLMILNAGDMIKRGALRMMLGKACLPICHDLIAADHDCLISGVASRPVFKPSPALLTELCTGEFGHALMVSRSLYRKVGGLFGPGDAGLYAARCINKAKSPVCIPQVLLTESGSDTHTGDAVTLSGELMLLPAKAKGYRRVYWASGKRPLVSVIIDAGKGFDLLAHCIERIEALSTYPRMELTVSHTGRKDARVNEYLHLLQKRGCAKAIYIDSDSPSVRMRAAAEVSRGRYLVFFASDLLPRNGDFIEELITPLLLPDIGVSGGKILSADGRLEHTGYILGLRGGYGSFYCGESDDESDSVKYEFTSVQRCVSAVSLDFAAIERRVFLNCASRFGSIIADPGVTLCKCVSENGLKTAYTPFACAMRNSPCLDTKHEAAPFVAKSRSFTKDECVSPVYDLRFSVPRIKLD